MQNSSTIRAMLCAIVITSTLFIGGVDSLYGQQPTAEDPLLDSLTGAWSLEGTIRTKHVVHEVHAQWILNHQFIELREVSQDRSSKDPTKPGYEALVLIGWDAAKKRYVVYWTDVYGGGFSLRGYAAKENNVIPIVFADDEGRFYTTLEYDSTKDSWYWSMDSEKGAVRSEFARLKMTRTSSTGIR